MVYLKQTVKWLKHSQGSLLVYLKPTVKWLRHSQVTLRISDGVSETNSEVVKALTDDSEHWCWYT